MLVAYILRRREQADCEFLDIPTTASRGASQGKAPGEDDSLLLLPTMHLRYMEHTLGTGSSEGIVQLFSSRYTQSTAEYQESHSVSLNHEPSFQSPYLSGELDA